MSQADRIASAAWYQRSCEKATTMTMNTEQIKRDEFLVFGAPVIGESEITEVMASMRSGWIGTGPKVHQFQGMLQNYIGAKHVRCVGSGTAALILGLTVAGIGPGDEVLVPAMTFVATANAVEHVGAKPVLVDCDCTTGLMDLELAEAAITPRTRGIMPVHLAGRPHDMDEVNRLRDKYEIVVIEDAAHAIGAEWRSKRIGSHGNLTAYSFYVTKNITTIEGGALATEDQASAEIVEQLALHGLSRGAWQRFGSNDFKHYEATRLGHKFNMTDVQASLGLHQLPQLDDWIKVRADQWARYVELLSTMPLLMPLDEEPGTRHARHLFQVRTEPQSGINRDKLLQFMTENGIGVGVHYRAVHMQPFYRDKYSLRPEDCPNAAAFSDTTFSLPLSPRVTEQDQLDVVRVLTAGINRFSR